jgi:hypothetical protein
VGPLAVRFETVGKILSEVADGAAEHLPGRLLLVDEFKLVVHEVWPSDSLGRTQLLEEPLRELREPDQDGEQARRSVLGRRRFQQARRGQARV